MNPPPAPGGGERRIRALNLATPAAEGRTGTPVYALWPSPVDHDVCFAQAGFGEFADSDDLWHAEFEQMTVRLLEFLIAEGEPRWIEGPATSVPFGFLFNALFGFRPTLERMKGAVLASAHDDHNGCTIAFGQAPSATLAVSGGHPIFWIHTGRAESWISQLAEHVAAGKPLERPRLDWARFTAVPDEPA